MKNINKILMLVFTLAFFGSCEKVTDREVDIISEGKNLVMFANSSKSSTNIADGQEYEITLPMKINGPNMDALANNVSVKVSVDESSTAEEGVHYRLGEDLVLSSSNDYLGLYNVVMLTDGVPSPESKELVLKVEQVSGDESVLNSGKPITVTLNYACPSYLEGLYDVETIYTAYDGSVSTLNWQEEIREIGTSTFRTTRVGHWTPDQLSPGTPGFTFTDLCGELSIPGQNLASYWANWVQGEETGSVDASTGVLKMKYSICSGGNCRYYESTYTPVN